MTAVAMQVANLSVEVVENGEAILRDVSFELRAGEIFAQRRRFDERR